MQFLSIKNKHHYFAFKLKTVPALCNNGSWQQVTIYVLHHAPLVLIRYQTMIPSPNV